MKVLFWSSLFLIFFAYAGYPIWLYFRARFCAIPVRRSEIFPSVTILLAVRNEQENLPGKLQNLKALEYPKNILEIIVVSDGSTDETNPILAAQSVPNLRAVLLDEHHGKAAALNCGVAEARGEIVVFTDARQSIAPEALKHLVANFADPKVGCVSGELLIRADPAVRGSAGVGLYWQLERKIRYWEALCGSTVGATGAFYGVRKNLLSPLPGETILDDVYIPMEVVRRGSRVVFEPRALASDYFTPSPSKEFRRKVRTLTGNYQLLQLSPWLLSGSNPLLFGFVCHKLLRLLVPFALVGIFVASLFLAETPYRVVLAFELLFAGLAALAMLPQKSGVVSRLANIPFAFLVLNTAAAVAFFYFISGKRQLWAR